MVERMCFRLHMDKNQNEVFIEAPQDIKDQTIPTVILYIFLVNPSIDWPGKVTQFGLSKRR
jgi:hypothetical protein